jgi:hypothetical protein
VGITYDTGALLAAERNDRKMWALHAGAIARQQVPTVPAVVIAEGWRGGGRQVNLARLLRLCRIESMDDERARAVGSLAAKAHHSDIVDVAVVEGAIRRVDAVVTSNPTHIKAIANAVGHVVAMHLV